MIFKIPSNQNHSVIIKYKIQNNLRALSCTWSQVNVEFVAFGYYRGWHTNKFNGWSDLPEHIWDYQTQWVCAALSSVMFSKNSWMQAKLGDPFFCIPHKVPHCPPAAQQGIQSLARHPTLPLTEHTEQLSLKWTTGLHPATPNTHTTTQHSAEEETQAPQHPLISLPRAGAMLIILLPS